MNAFIFSVGLETCKDNVKDEMSERELWKCIADYTASILKNGREQGE